MHACLQANETAKLAPDTSEARLHSEPKSRIGRQLATMQYTSESCILLLRRRVPAAEHGRRYRSKCTYDCTLLFKLSNERTKLKRGAGAVGVSSYQNRSANSRALFAELNKNTTTRQQHNENSQVGAWDCCPAPQKCFYCNHPRPKWRQTIPPFPSKIKPRRKRRLCIIRRASL